MSREGTLGLDAPADGARAGRGGAKAKFGSFVLVLVLFVFGRVEGGFERIDVEVELFHARDLELVGGPTDAKTRSDLLALEIGETAVSSGRSHGGVSPEGLRVRGYESSGSGEPNPAELAAERAGSHVTEAAGELGRHRGSQKPRSRTRSQAASARPGAP